MIVTEGGRVRRLRSVPQFRSFTGVYGWFCLGRIGLSVVRFGTASDLARSIHKWSRGKILLGYALSSGLLWVVIVFSTAQWSRQKQTRVSFIALDLKRRSGKSRASEGKHTIFFDFIPMVPAWQSEGHAFAFRGRQEWPGIQEHTPRSRCGDESFDVSGHETGVALLRYRYEVSI